MRNFSVLLASAAALSLAACAETETADATAEGDAMAADQMANADMAPGNLVEVAQGDANLSTLVTAVSAADLGDTLSTGGPYTVFAPTNDAFDKLPDGTLEELTTSQTDQLGNILQYHVVDGEVNAATLSQAVTEAGANGYTINTLGGGTLTARMDGSNIVLTDAAGGTATITGTDIDASNGIVHTIDSVLMPS